MVKKLFYAVIFLTSIVTTYAQKPISHSAADLKLQLKKLNTLGSVLYVAAHPDDENTRLITYLSKERLYNTAYLSLTRGDGGQNLIGPEIRETLGIIRTYELLGARSIDGGKQFFSRAVDFGYSKTPAETFTIWDSVQVLSDAVWVVRNFKPDVIITRFTSEPSETHGHHTASAILTDIAFKLASDPKAFPEQLKHTTVWQPKKLLWNTSRWFFQNNEKFDTTKMVMVNVGEYSPLIGKSYTEIAADARSMHRSQGFGAATSRGDAIEYLTPIIGTSPGTDLFSGIDVTWNRISGGEKIGKQIEQAIRTFDPEKPASIVPILLNARRDLTKLPESYWKTVKLFEIEEIIKNCLGLFLEASVNQHTVAHEEQLQVNFEAVNRSNQNVTLKSVRVKNLPKDTAAYRSLTYNQVFRFSTTVKIPFEIPVSQPFWLQKEGTVGMFDVEDQKLRTLAEAPAGLAVLFTVNVGGQDFVFETPIVHKMVDPAVGEVYKPLQVVPVAFAQLDKAVYVFADNKADTVKVNVKAGKNNLIADVKLEVPTGYSVSPSNIKVEVKQKGEEAIVSFMVTPPTTPSNGVLKVHVFSEGHDYSYSLVDIAYDHIPDMSWFPEAKAQVVKLDLKKNGERIGYIAGAGDAVAESLELIGYDVKQLTDADFNNNHLQRYHAIILGVRAYNVNNRLKFYQNQLMEYVKNGGVVIVQYNVNRGLVTDNIAPYSLQISRDRVTDESAEVKILTPDHPAMNYPNKIGPADFEHWVQERGLYFADGWDENFVPVISTKDKGEADKKGSLLIAKYGKGYYVYTGLSWFRQLPAGVPGAYRIFTNLISLGSQKENP